MDYPDPTLYAIPLFALLLAIEPRLLRRAREQGRDVLGFDRRDTRASIGLGFVSLAFVFVINLGVYTTAEWLTRYRLFDLGEGVVGWTVALIGWDFSYYWVHRVEHENRLLWACHVNHHSSRYYNLSTALRQPWTPFSHVLFFPGWALLGVAPWMIMVSGGLNLVYQYWIHTEAVDRMPRWFEAVFNTPSHHRVHHGANPEYLDKNYAGVLILWDRMFGTFEPERARVIYGLTKNIETYKLIEIAFHEYIAIARDMRKTPGFKNKLAILTHGPDWIAPQTEQV